MDGQLAGQMALKYPGLICTSSKPITDNCCGTRILGSAAARSTPIPIMSLQAKMAAQLLLRRIAVPARAVEQRIIKPDIVLRESTRAYAHVPLKSLQTITG